MAAEGVGAGRLDARQRRLQPSPGRLRGDQPGGLGLDHDAGDVVGDDVVQLPGEFQALVAAGGIDRELAADIDEAQPHSHAERAAPGQQPEERQREDVLGRERRNRPATSAAAPATARAAAWRAAATRDRRARPAPAGPGVAANPGWEGSRATSAATSAAAATARPAVAASAGARPRNSAEAHRRSPRPPARTASPRRRAGRRRRRRRRRGRRRDKRPRTRFGQALSARGDAVRSRSLATGYAARADREPAEGTILARAEPYLRTDTGRAGAPEAVVVTTSAAPLIIETRGLTKRFGSRTAVADVEPDGPGRLRVRVPRAQRRRQDHADPDADRPHPARRRHDQDRRPPARRAPPAGARPGRRHHRGAALPPPPHRPGEPPGDRGRPRPAGPAADRAGPGAGGAGRPGRRPGRRLLPGHAPAAGHRPLPAGRSAAASSSTSR